MWGEEVNPCPYPSTVKCKIACFPWPILIYFFKRTFLPRNDSWWSVLTIVFSPMWKILTIKIFFINFSQSKKNQENWIIEHPAMRTTIPQTHKSFQWTPYIYIFNYLQNIMGFMKLFLVCTGIKCTQILLMI